MSASKKSTDRAMILFLGLTGIALIGTNFALGAAKHTFVQLPSGRWSRVLGAPASCAIHVRGRVYKMSKTCAERML